MLGVAYKQDVDDYRESPAIRVIEQLLSVGAKVSYYDPWVPNFKYGKLEMKSIPTLTDKLLNEDVYKRQGRFLFICYSLVFLLLCLSFLLFPDNAPYLREILVNLLLISLPMLIYTHSIDNISILNRIFRGASVIILVLGTLFFSLVLFRIINIDVYSMSFSYYMVFPAISNMDKFFEKGEFRYLWLSLLASVLILLIGARGPLPVSYTHLDVYKRQLVETAKETGVDPYSYFTFILNEAAKLRAVNKTDKIADLTPSYFKNLS